jgi:hypothetical protein
MHSNGILNIDKVLVRQEIIESPFSCDLNKCKGACCTLESLYGAPLAGKEKVIIENLLQEVFRFIPLKNKEEIEQYGFWEEKDGSLMIRSIYNKECVFSYFEDGIAKCGIEKAYFNGAIDFRKPISCHLFPIRVSDFGGDVLRYEKFRECEPAIENGIKLNTTIAEFCKDSLTNLYGKEWFEKLSGYLRS